MTINLMVDSGAYTAWKKYTRLNIHDYIRLILANEPFIPHYFNLDIIPGSPGRRGPPEQIEQAAEESYRNQQLMKAAGLHPIPVFHPGERFHWLKMYLNDGELLIGLSIKSGPYQAMSWLTDCFKIIEKYPAVKVHGLGTVSVPILHRFPFRIGQLRHAVEAIAGWANRRTAVQPRWCARLLHAASTRECHRSGV